LLKVSEDTRGGVPQKGGLKRAFDQSSASVLPVKQNSILHFGPKGKANTFQLALPFPAKVQPQNKCTGVAPCSPSDLLAFADLNLRRAAFIKGILVGGTDSDVSKIKILFQKR